MLDLETKGFLKREARIAFKALSFPERQRLGSYKPLFREMVKAWNSGATIELPTGWQEKHREMEAGEEVEDNLGLHKLYGETPELAPGTITYTEREEQ
jgi:hypothetical protein